MFERVPKCSLIAHPQRVRLNKPVCVSAIHGNCRVSSGGEWSFLFFENENEIRDTRGTTAVVTSQYSNPAANRLVINRAICRIFRSGGVSDYVYVLP